MLGNEIGGGWVVKEWRPHPLMRAGGVFMSLVGIFVVGMTFWSAFLASKPADRIPAANGLIGMAVGISVAVLGCLFTFRYRIEIAGDRLTVVNLFTSRYSLGEVVSAEPGRSGLVFVMRDGTRCSASAVQTGLLARSLKRRTRADDVIDEVMKATYRRHR